MKPGEAVVDRLLVLDDNPRFLDLARAWGRHAGYTVTTASTVGDFEAIFPYADPGLLLLDVCLEGGMDASCTLHILDVRRFRGRIVLVSGESFTALNRMAGLFRAHGHDVMGIVEKGKNLARLADYLDAARLGGCPRPAAVGLAPTDDPVQLTPGPRFAGAVTK